MNIVFCSSVFDMAQYEKQRNKSDLPLGLADHKLNSNIILGLEENLGHPIKLVNNVQIPNYPHYPKRLFRQQLWSHTKGAMDINCGFVNLPVIKHFSRAITTYRALNKCIREVGEKNVFLITYDLHYGISLAVDRVLKRYPEIKSCLVMPDMPTAVLESSSGGNVRLKDRVIAQLKAKSISVYKSYVFITEQMSDLVNVKDKPYVVVEGIYDHQLPELETCHQEKKVVLYTGQLNPVYGLNNLIEAFLHIISEHDNYELWFCGAGPMTQKIQEIEKRHPQIKYLGYCNNEEIRSYQEQSTVLINPRQNTGEYTKYSFPSKTMDYLASGRPMIGYQLDGIPEEYDPYICYVEDNSVQTLEETILRVCELSDEERNRIADSARRFIITQKNPKTQCVKIIDMLKKLDAEVRVQ